VVNSLAGCTVNPRLQAIGHGHDKDHEQQAPRAGGSPHASCYKSAAL
jgi:hypothetical protein